VLPKSNNTLNVSRAVSGVPFGLNLRKNGIAEWSGKNNRREKKSTHFEKFTKALEGTNPNDQALYWRKTKKQAHTTILHPLDAFLHLC
jgi:hypothetical protein